MKVSEKYLEIKEFYRTLLHEEVKENVGENKRRNEKYQKRFQPREIKRGDYVYVKNNLTKGFVDPKYKGPFLVMGKRVITDLFWKTS